MFDLTTNLFDESKSEQCNQRATRLVEIMLVEIFIGKPLQEKDHRKSYLESAKFSWGLLV